MKAWWLRQARRFDALARRERLLIAVAVLGGILLVGFILFVEPALLRSRAAAKGLVEQRTQLLAVQAQTVALQALAQDPEREPRGTLSELKRGLMEVERRFVAMESELVPPQRIPGLLEDLIGHKSGLRLLSLKTLPASPVLEKSAGTKAADEAGSAGKAAEPAVADASGGLFKHGVEIRLEGSYQELASYLARLEQSPLKLLWSGVSLSAESHPKLVLTLTVYTLSLDRTWLIV